MSTTIYASGALKAFLEGRQKGAAPHELMNLKRAALAELHHGATPLPRPSTARRRADCSGNAVREASAGKAGSWCRKARRRFRQG
jgi:hypothetical protein